MNFIDSIQLAVTLGSIAFGVCATIKAADLKATKKLLGDSENSRRKLARLYDEKAEELMVARDNVNVYHVDAECARRALDKLCNDLNVAREVEHKRKKLVGVKFNAKMPNLPQYLRTEFKLGVGPCGKNVTSLQWTEHDDHYVLTQWCEDGERKEFKYLKSEIAGRIEQCITETAPCTTPLDADSLVHEARLMYNMKRRFRSVRNWH